MTESCLICKHFCCADEQLDNYDVLVCCCDKNGVCLNYLKDLAPCESFEEVK